MDKYFNIDEMMINYSEMTGFNFGSDAFKVIKEEVSEYSKKGYTFKYGNYSCEDFMHGLIEGV